MNMGYVIRWHDQYAIMNGDEVTFDNLLWTNDVKAASRWDSTKALEVKNAIATALGVAHVNFIVEDRT